MDRSPGPTLRDNVLKLLVQQSGDWKPSERGKTRGVTRLKKLGLTQGTAQRVLEGSTSIGLEILQQLASAFHVKPWHLLVPGLDVEALPVAGRAAWPFPMVDQDAYYALSEGSRGFVQAQTSNAIALRTAAEKPNGA